MKNKKTLGIAALVTSLVAISAFAAAISDDDKYKLNNLAGGPAFETQLGTLVDQSDAVNAASSVQGQVGTVLKRVVRVEYDAAKTSLGTSTLLPKTLGVNLPKSALITSAYFHIIRAFASTQSTAKIVLTCGQTSGNPNIIFTIGRGLNVNASSIGDVGYLFPSTVNSLPSQAQMMTKRVQEACTLTARPVDESFTAGKLVLFVEYVVTE